MSVGNVDKLPPIEAIEPFENDQNGRIFKTYPQHRIFHTELLPYDNGRYSRLASQSQKGSRGDMLKTADHSMPSSPTQSTHSIQSGHRAGSPEGMQKTATTKPKTAPPAATKKVTASTKSKKGQSKKETQATKPPTSAKGKVSLEPKKSDAKSAQSIYRSEATPSATESTEPSEATLTSATGKSASKQLGDNRDETKEALELDEVDEKDDEEAILRDADSLQDFRTQYGVPSDANLVRDWQAFRSHLVERVYESTGVSESIPVIFQKLAFQIIV